VESYTPDPPVNFRGLFWGEIYAHFDIFGQIVLFISFGFSNVQGNFLVLVLLLT
jgi:hypothetical protein